MYACMYCNSLVRDGNAPPPKKNRIVPKYKYTRAAVLVYQKRFLPQYL